MKIRNSLTRTGSVSLALAAITLAGAALSAATPDDWPAWRGPTRDGIAAPGQSPPLRWSESENVLWRVPIPGREHSSPTVVGNRIYATSLAGVTSVFEARPDRFKLLAQNQLGTEVYATPAICGNRIYLRVAQTGDPRQEFLYCLSTTAH